MFDNIHIVDEILMTILGLEFLPNPELVLNLEKELPNRIHHCLIPLILTSVYSNQVFDFALNYVPDMI